MGMMDGGCGLVAAKEAQEWNKMKNENSSDSIMIMMMRNCGRNTTGGSESDSGVSWVSRGVSSG